jgi:hypothetical protein
MALPEDTLLNNRYRILGQLGQGGMGAVYHAMDESLGVEVAVKENKIDDEDYNRQFKREAKILANMRHPNLPRVTDHFVTDDGQYLVMDFVEGEDLRSRLERLGQVEEKEVVLIGAALCDALEYLHTQDPPILHRDVKPGNIKVTPSGHVFLVDFGLAKVGPTTQQTTTGARGLTPGYSPPEQYGSARTDARSDVYALGATLYALLTGTPPEDGLSIAIQQSTLTAITKHKPSTSEKLATVIEKALDVQPEKRYQRAGEFKKALLEASDTIRQEVVAGDVTIAPPPPSAFKRDIEKDDRAAGGAPPAPGTQVSKPERSGPNWVLISGSGALVIILALVSIFVLPGFLGGGGDDPTPTTVVQEPSDVPAVVEIDPTEVPVVVEEPTEEIVEEPTDLPTEEAVVEAAGPQIVFASQRDGSTQLWMITLESDEPPVQLTTISGGACQPVWSPDGTTLAFISPCTGRFDQYPRASIYTLDVSGGGEPQLLDIQGTGYDPVWTPDGSAITFVTLRDNNSPRLYSIHLESGRVDRLAQPNTQNIQPTYSPDGNFLAFMLSGQVWVQEIATGKVQQFTASDRQIEHPRWSPDGTTIIFIKGSPSFIQAATWPGNLPVGLVTVPDFRLVTDAIPMKDASWSPDGRFIVFTSNAGGDGSVHDVYIVPSSGSGAENITRDAAFDLHPAWRP